MKSIAAYYVLVAMNTQDQDAQRHARSAAARPQRPSFLARARALVASARSTPSAATAG
jgi:hypothetical protein